MPTAGVTHDLTISCVSGSNKKGFMLARNRNGSRGFGLADAQTIQDRVLSMGALTEQEADPRFRGYWTQGCFRDGLGGVDFLTAPQALAISTKIDTSFDGKIKSAPELFTTTVDCNPTANKPSGFGVVGTEVWSFVGRNTYQWDYSALDWNIGNTPQALDVVYKNGVELGDDTYAPAWDACCSGARYIHKADADSCWTLIGTCTPNKFKYFAKSRNANGGEILVGAHICGVNNVVRTSTGPCNTGNWSTATVVGGTDSPITGLVEGPDNQVFVLKTDGVWSFPSTGIVENLTPEYETRAHPCNFRGGHNWNGQILLPLGGGGMVALIQNSLFNVSMQLFAPEQTTLHGRVVAIHGGPETLRILVLDEANTKFHLLMSEFVSIGGREVDYHWHQIGEVSYTGTMTSKIANHAALMAEGVPGPSAQVHARTWVAVESVCSNLLPHFSPTATDVQFGYTNDCDQSAQSVLDCRNFRRVCKSYATLDLVHNNLGAGGRQFTIDYRLDSGCWKTDLNNGSCTNVVTSTAKTSTLTFPVGTTGKTLELRFKPNQTSVTATSPELEKFTVTSQLRPCPLKTFQIDLYLADQQWTLNGGTETKTAGNLSQLKTWDGQASEVTVIDPEGVSRSMVFLPGTFNQRETTKAHARRSEWVISALLTEV